MFQYYNAHPYGLEVEDCVKRAITVTTRLDYREVQQGLNQHKRITGAKRFFTDGNPDSYVRNVLGFPRIPLPKRDDGSRMTAEEFCAAYPKGRYIISMSGHWSAVINGYILDTWDCRGEELYSYYAVTPLRKLDEKPIKNGFIIRRASNEKAVVSFYDGNGTYSSRTISAEHIDGYRACLLDMGHHEAVDWSDEKWK